VLLKAEWKGDFVASITIRNPVIPPAYPGGCSRLLDGGRGARHLRSSLNQEPQEPQNLGTAINALFEPFGGFDLPEVPRERMREPPTFDEWSSSTPHRLRADEISPHAGHANSAFCWPSHSL
jgi:hypothetical protein